MTTANITIAIQCKGIKIIPIFFSEWQKIFLVCRRRSVISLCAVRCKRLKIAGLGQSSSGLQRAPRALHTSGNSPQEHLLAAAQGRPGSRRLPGAQGTAARAASSADLPGGLLQPQQQGLPAPQRASGNQRSGSPRPQPPGPPTPTNMRVSTSRGETSA